MAGDWIKFDTSTPDKPEVWQIAARTEMDPDAVIGKLLRVWTWFDEQSEDGNAPSVTKMLLDRKVGVTGFCDAMVQAGWMIDDGKIISLPNFTRHNGKTAKNRSLTARRVSKHKESSNAKGNAPSVNNALPREEKRREEVLSPDGDTSPSGSDSGPPSCPHEEIINLYHEILPELPRVAEWNDTRRSFLRSRWREKRDRQTLDWWRKYFQFVRECPFLLGDVPGRGDSPPFCANLEWLVRPKNFVKVLEGHYARGE